MSTMNLELLEKCHLIPQSDMNSLSQFRMSQQDINLGSDLVRVNSLSDDKLIYEVMPLIDTDVLGYNTIQAIIYKVQTLLNFQQGRDKFFQKN